MEKVTKSNLVQPGQSAAENKNLPDDGELQEDELDEVSGGTSPKLISEMLSNMQKTRAEISQTFARNSRA